MKKKINISNIVLLLLLVAAVKFSGCETEDLDFYIDCDFCLEEIPTYDTLWAHVTINEENPFVPLEYYIGDVENGELFHSDTTYTEYFGLQADVDVNYSIKARYNKDGKILIAIDGDKLKVVNGEEECYPPCYYLRGGSFELTLSE